MMIKNDKIDRSIHAFLKQMDDKVWKQKDIRIAVDTLTDATIPSGLTPLVLFSALLFDKKHQVTGAESFVALLAALGLVIYISIARNVAAEGYPGAIAKEKLLTSRGKVDLDTLEVVGEKVPLYIASPHAETPPSEISSSKNIIANWVHKTTIRYFTSQTSQSPQYEVQGYNQLLMALATIGAGVMGLASGEQHLITLARIGISSAFSFNANRLLAKEKQPTHLFNNPALSLAIAYIVNGATIPYQFSSFSDYIKLVPIALGYVSYVAAVIHAMPNVAKKMLPQWIASNEYASLSFFATGCALFMLGSLANSDVTHTITSALGGLTCLSVYAKKSTKEGVWRYVDSHLVEKFRKGAQAVTSRVQSEMPAVVPAQTHYGRPAVGNDQPPI